MNSIRNFIESIDSPCTSVVLEGFDAIFESYGHQMVEMVPTSTLNRFKEFTRDVPMGGDLRYQELKADIKENGIKEPLILMYFQHSKSVLLVEGNHRLRIANELGINELPVRVSRYEGDDSHYPKAVAIDSPLKQYGYVPGDLKPSDIGIV